MWPKPNKSKSKLCCIDLNNVNQDTRYSELDKPRPVKVHEVEEHPNIKIVGKR